MPRTFLLLLVACALAGYARADEEAQPPRERVVVYTGVEASTIAAQQATTLVELLTDGATVPEAPIHIDALFPDGQLGVVGAETWESCQGAALSAEAYGAMVEALYKATTHLEDTTGQADALLASQACLTEPAATADLARVPFLEGVTAYGDGDVDAAQAAFADVFVIEPQYAWDPEYPPDAQLAFANAGTGVLRLGLTGIQVVAPAGAEVWIDGHSAGLDEPAHVIPGRHLVQLRPAADQPLLSAVVVAPADATTVVLSGVGLGAPEGPVEGLTAINAALVGADAPAVGWFVQLWPTVAAWSWDASAGVVQEEEVPPTAAAAVFGAGETLTEQRERKSRFLPAVIGVGVGTLVAGAVIAGASGRKAAGMAADAEAGMPFAHPDDDDPTDEQQANTDAFNSARGTAGVGVGLMAAGGVALAISIPLKIKLDRANQPTDVTVAAVLEPPAPGSDVPCGFGLRVSFR
jgi:hypothetical protein